MGELIYRGCTINLDCRIQTQTTPCNPSQISTILRGGGIKVTKTEHFSAPLLWSGAETPLSAVGLPPPPHYYFFFLRCVTCHSRVFKAELNYERWFVGLFCGLACFLFHHRENSERSPKLQHNGLCSV